jgi:glycosidase
VVAVRRRRLPEHPLVHEVFTWVWLDELSRATGRRIDLGCVPAEAWDRVAGPGIDAVWLMGVWERSPAGAAIARAHPAMASAHRGALADLADEDVVGSAFCIRSYSVDARLGGDEGLATARRELAARSAGLVLDFVPNHVAPDHPWTTDHPEYFVRGTRDDLGDGSYLAVGDAVLACGRDPYFPAWPDVVQLATSRADVRAAAADDLASIGARCDAIRCDMAMLVLDDVHARIWADRAAPPEDDRGYWPTVFERVRATHPDTIFWAEAYWGLEPELIDLGFDACYDKVLYDHLVERRGAPVVRDHIGDIATPGTIRFAENHDEPRLAAALPGATGRPAALLTLTSPGVALLHEGQPDGRHVRVPVTLGRRPDEPADPDTADWYERVLGAIASGLRRGRWRPAGIDPRTDDQTGDRTDQNDGSSAGHLVASVWVGTTTFVVVVNLSDEGAEGTLRTEAIGDDLVVLHDHLTGDRYEREEIATSGLHVVLGAHGSHLFEVVAAVPPG